MMDQAERLRQLAAAYRSKAAGSRMRVTQVIAVTSGKGGVGKTNLSVNIGQGLVAAGKEVILLDADLGLANADILLGTVPPYHLGHLLNGDRDILELVHRTTTRLQLIAGGSGLAGLADLGEIKLAQFLASLSKLDGMADFLIIDTGAGVGHAVQKFVLASDQVLVVTTPEPTAVADAYTVIKVLSGQRPGLPMRLIVNQAERLNEAAQVAERLILTAGGFLGQKVEHLGTVPRDPYVWQAVRQQVPFVVAYPGAPASRAVDAVVRRLLGEQEGDRAANPVLAGFFSRLNDLFRNRSSNAV